MICRECQGENRDDAVFCGDCGVRLPEVSESEHSPQIVADRYEIAGLIGEGGMKQVFAGTDTRLGRQVAIAFFKTDGLSANDLSRIDREIKTMISLGDHPSIVSVLDFGEDSGKRFIVTPLMDGGDLATRTGADGGSPLAVGEAMEIGACVADALAHAHSAGVIHRDLKPENVWFGSDGKVRLGDFGLAVVLDQSRITQDGTILGTPAYLAPESASGGGLASNEKSDLYSLGVFLYELTTGRQPFDGSMTEIISQHINVPPVAPKSINPEIPTTLEALILALMAKSPERRPESAKAVADALRAMRAAGELGGNAATRPVGRDAPGTIDAVIAVQQASRKIIGRRDELAALQEILDLAAAGSPAIVTVAGEPGIGKTRLVEEACSYAEIRGFTTVTGRCLEDEGAPAFWPWVGALRELLEVRPSEELRGALGNSAAVIARVLPEISRLVPGLETELPPSDPEQARFQLFDGITGFLRRTAEAKPVVVVLEDVHWADTPSLRLLQFVAQAMARERLVVISTFRDVELGRHHPLASALGDLARCRYAQRISLSGLSLEQIAELIEAIIGREAPESLAEAVKRQTEGNPFFIGEVVRLLEDRGTAFDTDPSSWSTTIPQGVREVVGQRLNRLSDECNQILSIAAVIGREFPLALLEKAVATNSSSALEAIGEAEEARLVEASPSTPGTYGFNHALVRETLYQELSTARRAMLHRKVGVAIEELYASNLGPHLSELAYHFLHSAGGDDLTKAIDYLNDAAKRSIEMLAYEDAVALYENAIEAIELAGMVDTELHCDILLGLGDALWRAREGTRAKSTLREAWDLARALGDGRRFAKAVLDYPGGIGGYGLINEDIDEFIVEALGRLDEDDIVTRARLLSERSWTLGNSDSAPKTAPEYDELQTKIMDEAIALARESGDPQTLLETLGASHGSIGDPSRIEERLAWAETIIECAETIGDWDALVQGILIRIADLFELGKIEEIPSEILRVESIIARGRGLNREWLLWTAKATLALLRGEFDDAQELIGRNLTIANQGDEHEMLKLIIATVQSLTIFTEQQRLREIEPIYAGAARAFSKQQTMRGGIAALAYIYASVGKTEEAKKIIDDLAENNLQIVHNQNWMSSMAYLAMACSIVGDVERARIAYEQIKPFGHLTVTVASALACLGSVSRYLGLLATTFGDTDAARSHFEDAIEANDRLGARPYAAHSRHELAELILANDGDRAEARELIESAIKTYQDVGMDGYAEDARNLLASVG